MKLRCIGKESQKLIQNKETIDTELANELYESPSSVYYKPDLNLAKRNTEKRATLSRSTNQTNEGNLWKAEILPQLPSFNKLYPHVYPPKVSTEMSVIKEKGCVPCKNCE